MTDNFEKKCVVCGDRATGYNFNVFSCVSCKAFFRRNAFKQLKCPFNEQCQLNLLTRKFCSKCRLNRCLIVGMKKELILTEEEKQIRKNKLLEKRKNLKQNNASSDGQSSTSGRSPTQQVDSTTEETSFSSRNTPDIDDQFIAEILSDDSISERDIELQIKEIENSITDEREDEISPEVYRKCLELDFAVMPVLRPLTDYSNNFNEAEGNRLTELFSALSIMKCSFGPITAQPSNWSDAVCIMADDIELKVEKLIQSTKQLTFFNDLCNDDQIALVKYGALQVSCMRQVAGYDCQTDQIIVSGENPMDFVMIKLALLKEKTQGFYDVNKKFYESVAKEWDSDQTILDLLTAIVFFDPNRPHLTHREAIRYQQYVYMFLLKRYLKLRYQTECVATTKFLRLMNTMKYLNNLYLTYIRVYGELSDQYVETDGNQICESVLHEIFKV